MNSTKKFSVVIPNSIEKLIKKYPFFVQSKFKDTIERFEKGERVDIIKKHGSDNEYRIRIGRYRIILIKTKTTEFYVSDFGPRENIYGFII
ncbi:MAG: PCP reductase family protein [Nanoarchaeota archaeon]